MMIREREREEKIEWSFSLRTYYLCVKCDKEGEWGGQKEATRSTLSQYDYSTVNNPSINSYINVKKIIYYLYY